MTDAILVRSVDLSKADLNEIISGKKSYDADEVFKMAGI